jgi:hypothetical protein
MRITSFSIAVSYVSLIALGGCKHYNAINFVTNTEFGVKVGVNAEKIPEAKIGYSRQEAARVPVYLMEGTMANRTSGEVNSLLNQADKSLQAAVTSIGTPATQKDDIRTANRLIDAAVRSDKEDAKGNRNSSILPKIKEAAVDLPSDGITSASKDNISFVRGMIAAERERPVFHTEFQEAGKFIGSKIGKEANDAYSVIGTFKGNAGGGSGSQSNVKMGIAQYFATGIAAQLLAENGGAALVSTANNAQAPVDNAAVEQAKKRGVDAISDAERIVVDVHKPSGGAAASQAVITQRLTTFFQEAKLAEGDTPAGEAAYYATLSQYELKVKLANYYSKDLKKMVAKIPLP